MSSHFRSLLGRPFLRLRLGIWLMIVISVLSIGGILFGIFFVRRDVVQYWPEHHFPVSDPAFFGSAHALGDPLPVPGNRIDLLHNGDAYFPAMLEAIRGAKSSVNFEAFLMYSGSIATVFQDALIERAQAGVTVRVLLDGVGSGSKLKESDVERMRQKGVRASYYNPVRSFRVDRVNRRSHRRILVVDGRVAFTGSAGFADQWTGNADAPEHWRDIQVRIEGPLVAKLQGAFQQHWVFATGELLSGAAEFPPLPPAGKLEAQMTASHSFSIAPVPLLQAVAIASAEKRICITNAYCTPSDYQVELLGRAVERGVEVTLLLPGKHNDEPATKAAGRTAYGNLLLRGVKIMEYEPTMIHTKSMVVDGVFSLIGSSNLDARSTQINEELDISVYDPVFGREMERFFDEDIAHSKPYTLEQFRNRGVWERLSEWATLPFRSQL